MSDAAKDKAKEDDQDSNSDSTGPSGPGQPTPPSDMYKGEQDNAREGGKITKEVIKRAKPGGDGGASEHIIEKMDDKTISKTHRVTKDGKVVHQHQDHVGKHGGERRFPDEWTGTKTRNAPTHIPRVGP